MNLLTIADGFGDSKAHLSWYPDYFKWPEIIQLMTKGVSLTNCARYGAGNEYIINCLQEHVSNNDVVFVQWASPSRLDLLLEHSPPYDAFWQEQIQIDPVYNNNVVSVGGNNFWISSATTNPNVIEYHQKYISLKQHQMRSQLIIDYAKLLIEKHQIKDYGFLLTYDGDYLKNTKDRWVWHEKYKGMHSFRKVSKYADLDFGYAQPIPLIHFDFIKQFIMPNYDLPWRSQKEIDAVESMLHRKHKNAIINKPNDTN